MDKDTVVSTEAKAPELNANQILLPSGVVATFIDFKARDVMAMRKTMDEKDEDTILYSMISAMVRFDGKVMIMEDVAEMPGWDFIAIQSKITSSGGFMSIQGK